MMRNLSEYALMSAMLICTLPVYGATARDNYVYFKGAGDYFQWHEASHKITDGQPWNYLHYGTSDGEGVIHIQAGRKGSEEVADWFKEKVGIGHAISTKDNTPVGWPDELNFATYGHMNLKDSHGRYAQCHRILIAQGHAGTYNNWWIGSENLHAYGGKYWLVCPPVNAYCGAVVAIDPSFTSSDLFTLDIWTCPPAVSVSLSPDVLWPANDKMYEIEASISVGDTCGSDPIEEDEIGADDRVFKLRAERFPDGNGRVYTVTYDIGCDSGITTVEATVTVPHDKGKNKRLMK
jgi:hypothetical protein